MSFISIKREKPMEYKELTLNLNENEESLKKRVETLEDLIWGNKGAASILKRIDELEQRIEKSEKLSLAPHTSMVDEEEEEKSKSDQVSIKNDN